MVNLYKCSIFLSSRRYSLSSKLKLLYITIKLYGTSTWGCIIFRVEISLLPNYRVKYYYYNCTVVQGIACTWSASLDIGLIWALVKHYYHLGVNISERKSGTERTKKRKKTGVSIFFSPPGGAAGKTTGKTHAILQTDTGHDHIWWSCIQ